MSESLTFIVRVPYFGWPSRAKKLAQHVWMCLHFFLLRSVQPIDIGLWLNGKFLQLRITKFSLRKPAPLLTFNLQKCHWESRGKTLTNLTYIQVQSTLFVGGRCYTVLSLGTSSQGQLKQRQNFSVSTHGEVPRHSHPQNKSSPFAACSPFLSEEFSDRLCMCFLAALCYPHLEAPQRRKTFLPFFLPPSTSASRKAHSDWSSTWH